MSRGALLGAALACVMAGAARAEEGPPAVSFFVEENVISVRARGAVPKRDRMTAHRDHLDIHLAEAPAAAAKVSVEDALLKRIELSDGSDPKLQIFIHDAQLVDALEKTGRIERHGNDLRVVLPRDPKAALAALKKSGAAEEGDADKAVASAEHGPEKADKADKKGKTARAAEEVAPAPARPEPVPSAMATAAPAAKAEAFPVGQPDPKPVLGGAPETSATSGILVFLVLVAFGGAAAYVVRKRQQQAPLTEGQQIRIVSSTAIGPRLRLVLVKVQGREMLLSVSDRGAQLLDRWHADDDAALLDGEVDAPALQASVQHALGDGRRAALAAGPEAAASGPELHLAFEGRAPRVESNGAPAVEEEVDLKDIEKDPNGAPVERAVARPDAVQLVPGGGRAQAAPPAGSAASVAVQGLLRLRLQMDGQPRPGTPAQGTAATGAGTTSPDPQWASELRMAAERAN